MSATFRLVGRELVPVSGELAQISVGQGSSVWGINTSHRIFRLNAATGSFEQVPGQLTSISVGAENGNAVWGINASSEVFQFNRNTGSFKQVPGLLTSISVGLAPWGLNASNEIFVFDFGEGSFQRVPGALVSISAGADGTVWGLNASHGIFRCIAGTLSFTQVPGALVSISATADGTAWGINASAEIFHFDPGTASFKQVPGLLSSLVASRDGSVWGINKSAPLPLPEQLDFDFPSITFDNGVPVGGSTHLTLHRTGEYLFTGNFHDSGGIGFTLNFLVGVKDSAANLYTFSPPEGKVAGTFEPGSPNYIWSIPNSHPLITQNWPALAAGSSAVSAQTADLDLGGLLAELVSAAGFVVKNVIPLLTGGESTAPPDPGPDGGVEGA